MRHSRRNASRFTRFLIVVRSRQQRAFGTLYAARVDAARFAVATGGGSASPSEVGDRTNSFEMRLGVRLLVHDIPPTMYATLWVYSRSSGPVARSVEYSTLVKGAERFCVRVLIDAMATILSSS